MAPVTHLLSNAEISRRLVSYARVLQTRGENPFKVRAYRRAAQTIKGLRASLDCLVREGRDLTRFPGIGKGIASALREIVFSGTLGQLELVLSTLTPEQIALNEYPRLDPKRAARVFKKFNISTVDQLKQKLEAGAISVEFGPRMADHFFKAFREIDEILLDDADLLAAELKRFLLGECGATRLEIAGDVRRRVEAISEIVLLVQTEDFPATTNQFSRFRGGVDLLETANGMRGFSFRAQSS